MRAPGRLARRRALRAARPRRAHRRGGPLRATALEGVPEIAPGDNLGAILSASARRAGIGPGDVLVVAHKVVSKAEAQVVELAGVSPGPAARRLAEETGKDPALCELVLAESRRIVRRRGGTLIVETHHGFVCANAGIDSSNVAAGWVVLLPRDPDASARRIQVPLARAAGGRVGVVVCDTHGRAFRRGLVNVAIGVAGFEAVADHRGARDREGRVLVATEQAVADELAAASGLLMPKAGGTPAVLFSGVVTIPAPGRADALVRAVEHDLFRGPPAD